MPASSPWCRGGLCWSASSVERSAASCAAGACRGRSGVSAIFHFDVQRAKQGRLGGADKLRRLSVQPQTQAKLLRRRLSARATPEEAQGAPLSASENISG